MSFDRAKVLELQQECARLSLSLSLLSVMMAVVPKSLTEHDRWVIDQIAEALATFHARMEQPN